MFDPDYRFTCADRFLNYVKYDTQSDEDSNTFPSSAKQLIFLKVLVKELKAVGLEDAHLDEYGYVIATLPSNVDKDVPVIGFIAHVDTSPAVTGLNVNPIIHKNYQGGDIVLPNDKTQVIEAEKNPDLKNMAGFDIITTDGTTLLGADNKAGVAEIIDAMNYMIRHSEVKHGTIKVCFTPDEEVGRGTEKFDVEKFGAKYAYTVDGSSRGEVEIETFSADAVVVKFIGRNIHPGYAKDKMVNAIKVASYFIDSLPKDHLSPETTEKREGFIHVTSVNGNEELVVVRFIARDFVTEKLEEYEILLKELAEKAVEAFPGSRMDYEIIEQYRNMKYVLENYPQVAEYAIEALGRLGIQPILSPIRGGTDGSRLSYMGLPTPNIFAGEHSFHSRLEWVAVQDMEMSVRNIVTIAEVWAEKS
ncbi:MAG: peptidase T [Ignavibacteria bacterium]